MNTQGNGHHFYGVSRQGLEARNNAREIERQRRAAREREIAEIERLARALRDTCATDEESAALIEALPDEGFTAALRDLVEQRTKREQ